MVSNVVVFAKDSAFEALRERKAANFGETGMLLLGVDGVLHALRMLRTR